MQTTHFRNLLHLFGRKVVLLSIFLLLFLCFSSSAQNAKGNYNYLDFNQKPYYFGITLGYNSSNFKVYRSQNFIMNDSVSRVESINGPGFNLGIVTNLRIGEYFDIRFLPTLSFAERNLRYNKPKEPVTTFDLRKVESVFIEMPFQVRFKSAPYRDKRLFVVGGIKYVFDVASESRTRQASSLVKISPTDFAAELGVGIQMYFPYFIFSPELKFSHGMGNILLYNKNLNQSTVLEKVFSRGFTLSLHFEG